MEQTLNLKIRSILAYLLPFIILITYSIIIDLIGSSILSTDKLIVKYLLDMFISISAPIAFILMGFYVAPKDKLKTTRNLSLILSVMTLFVIMSTLDSPLQLSTYIAIIISTVVTTVILYKKNRGI